MSSIRPPTGPAPELQHPLLVELPAPNSRARRWAMARGVDDIDHVAFATMLRAERLSYG